MINSPIKRFKSFFEELTGDQKTGFREYAYSRFGIKIPKFGPSRRALALSDHVMPEGTDSIKIPVMNPTMQEIHDHLTSNGYAGMDYGNQKAFKDVKLNDGSTKRTEVKIGKALSQTGASKSLIGRFANDNHKESAELASKYSIIFSRDPHHIAECSTDKPWSSCARLDHYGEPASSSKELAAARLPFDIEKGTHVAYLVPNMDHPDNQKKYAHIADDPSHQDLIDHAQARILVKPHYPRIPFGYDNTKTALVPEETTYSNMDKVPSGFYDSIKNFTDKHFPMEENTVYHKDDDLYNDGLDKQVKINLNKPLDDLPRFDDYSSPLTNQSHIKSEDITNFMNEVKSNPNHPNKDFIKNLPDLPNFSTEHMDHFINNWSDLDDVTKTKIMKKPLSKEQHGTIFNHFINHISNDEYHNNNIIHSLINSKHTTSGHMLNLLKAIAPSVPFYGHNQLLSSDKLKGKDLDSAIELYKGGLGNSNIAGVAYNPNLEKHHIDKLLTHRLYNSTLPALGFDSTSAADIHGVLDNLENKQYHPDNHGIILNSITRNPNFNSEHLQKMISMNTPDKEKVSSGIKQFIFNNRDMKPEDLHTLIDNSHKLENTGFIFNSVNSSSFDDDHISKLIEPNKLSELGTGFYNHILNRFTLKKEHMDKLSNPDFARSLEPNQFYRLIHHANFEPEHLDNLMSGFSKLNGSKQHDILTHNKFTDHLRAKYPQHLGLKSTVNAFGQAINYNYT